jgi:acetyl esterase/lipase
MIKLLGATMITNVETRKSFRHFLAMICMGLSLTMLAAENDGNAVQGYRSELNLPYCSVAGQELTLNAFLPKQPAAPVPALVEIHGGWWHGGNSVSRADQVGGFKVFAHRGLAIFSIQYRLGKEGGFPECIRDCRNAIRFIRLNARRFNIDADRIDVTGGSAGGHLSLMVAMVPEDFDDGGPTPGLEGVSARVSGGFSYIPPTDLVRFWNQGPDDAVTNMDGKVIFRGPDEKIPNDSHPRLRVLFHGITPDTAGHQDLYTRMCPMGQVRQDVPPLLVCDGEHDPIVPGLHGKALYDKLKAAGADATYWVTTNGGHGFPGGPGFEPVLDNFVARSLKLDAAHGVDKR